MKRKSTLTLRSADRRLFVVVTDKCGREVQHELKQKELLLVVKALAQYIRA